MGTKIAYRSIPPRTLGAALIVAFYPAITAFLEFLLFRVQISWVKGLGIVIAVFVVKYYSMITVSFYRTIVGIIAFISLAFIERTRWRVPNADCAPSVLVQQWL